MKLHNDDYYYSFLAIAATEWSTLASGSSVLPERSVECPCAQHKSINIARSRMASVAQNNNAALQPGENSGQGNTANSIPTTKDEVKEVHVDGLVVLQLFNTSKVHFQLWEKAVY